jgi:hypothetical protein
MKRVGVTDKDSECLNVYGFQGKESETDADGKTSGRKTVEEHDLAFRVSWCLIKCHTCYTWTHMYQPQLLATALLFDIFSSANSTQSPENIDIRKHKNRESSRKSMFGSDIDMMMDRSILID